MNARIYLLSEETRFYERVNLDVVEAIRHKRTKYYNDYEMDLPRSYSTQENQIGEPKQKAKAIKMLNALSQSDVTNLRRIKSYSRMYELFSAPLVILWDQKPERKATADGRVTISYWKTAFKILNDKQFFTKLKNFKLESISQKKFEQIEQYI